MAENSFGIDIVAAPDIDPTFRLCSGLDNLKNAIVRRLNTQPGAMAAIGDDPEYGYDVLAQLNRDVCVASAAGVAAMVRAEVMKDPRVFSANANVVVDAGGESMRAEIHGETEAGPFAMVMPVSAVSADVLNYGVRQELPVDQNSVIGARRTVINQAGPPGPAGASGLGKDGVGQVVVAPDFDGLFATSTTSETLFKQTLADFTKLPTGTLTVKLAATARALDGATATFRVRVGGLDGVVDGVIIATVTTTSSGFTVVSANGSLNNPGGVQRCKLTGESSVTGADVQIKATLCEIFAQ